ncbi:MAG: hypothetical protein ACPGVB_10180 [Chitinophagales bacterium]
MKDFLDYINSQNIEQLRSELQELFSSYEVVRNYFHIKIKENGEVDKFLLRKYEDEITKAIYPNERMEGGLDIGKVDNIIKGLNSDSTVKYYIECSLFSIEECTNIANEFGGDFGEDFFIYFEELFENVTKIIINQGHESEYKIRLREIADSAFDGYGHYDQLQDTVNEYFRE